jgi:hypothetical protein
MSTGIGIIASLLFLAAMNVVLLVKLRRSPRIIKRVQKVVMQAPPKVVAHNALAVAAAPLPQHQVPTISPQTAAELEAIAKANYLRVLDESNATFKADLEATSKRLGEQVTDLTTRVIEKELDQYHDVLEEVTTATTQTMSRIQEVIDERRKKVEETMLAEVQAEKQRLLERFDDHLSDIVSSYLVESLGQNVDLGAQTAYIIKALDEHKEELKREVLA